MNATSTTKRVINNPTFTLLWMLLLLFILPQFGAWAMMVAAAGMLSVYVALTPEHFRNSNGSLTTAIGLVTAMWVAAVVVSALTLNG